MTYLRMSLLLGLSLMVPHYLGNDSNRCVGFSVNTVPGSVVLSRVVI